MVLVAVGAAIGLTDIHVVPGRATPEEVHRRGRGSVGHLEVQSLDGSGNNLRHPSWGRAGTDYIRVAPANYADGLGEPVPGPNSRYLSNRIFNDQHVNLFSENGATQWVWTWGQFIDHNIGLRDDGRGSAEAEPGAVVLDPEDPLEEFVATTGVMELTRSAAAPGTGETGPREQVNLVSSYIDGWAIYGGARDRLSWLRDGDSARLYLPDGYLPRRDSRGDPGAAPAMEAGGRLRGQPDRAVVAGDVRANENAALTAVHTLLAREHNRIVGELPGWLGEDERFEIARRVVIAEIQHITYNEFLPAVGIGLAPYQGYDPTVVPDLTNEFATVGYRGGHSMIHGEIEIEAEADRYTTEELDAFEAMGIEVEVSEDGSEVEMAAPLNVVTFNPDLVEQVGLGPMLGALSLEPQYNNDEMIDNQLRSVLFEIPVPENPQCLDGPELPDCFQGIVDLGALDVERSRDHGMPSYNDMRRAYGLEPVASFQELTGETTEEFPQDPLLTPGREMDDPDSLDVLQMFEGDVEVPVPEDGDTDASDDDGEVAGGGEVEEGTPTHVVRRTTVAARLKALYGDVDRVDAFVGMVVEPHAPGAELGELQMAIWERQFQALRDGDRFFYGNNADLVRIRERFGIDFRVTLADLIAANTDLDREDLGEDPFFVAAG